MKKKNFLLLVTFIFTIMSLFSGCKKETKLAENMEQYITGIDSITMPDNIKIVGLGEATHGNAEFQILKKEVFEALVKNNGCRIFAIEGDFGGCQKVNNYILNGEGTAKEAVAQIGFSIYRTEEMVDLIQWIHDYNKSLSEPQKIKFYGFDMQRYDNNKEGLLSYIEKINPDMASKYRDLLVDLNDDTVYTQDPSKVKEALKNIENLISEMELNKNRYIKATNEKEYSLALQFAQSIKENATLRDGKVNYSQMRDEYMSNKVKWILEHEGSDMIFINGHNGHIEKSSASPVYTSMGNHLADEFGDAYYAIGTDFYNSTFTAVTSNDEVKNFTLTNQNELVDQFIDLPGNEYFMDFEKVKSNPILKSIIDEKQPMANIGAEFNDWQGKIKKFYTLNMIPSKAYNGIIVVKNATPRTVIED